MRCASDRGARTARAGHLKSKLALLPIAALVGTCAAQITSGPAQPGPVPQLIPWEKVNGGHYIDAGFPATQPNEAVVLRLSNGDIRYFFRTANFGYLMGRLSATREWQLWSDPSWSSASDLVPASVEHMFGRYGRLRPFERLGQPGNQPVLGGVALSCATRSGPIGFNAHGFTTSFRFDGVSFDQWDGDDVYDPNAMDPVFRAWPGSAGDFAFDPATGTGIAVGRVGPANQSHTGLTAALYVDTDNVPSWRRWTRESTANDPNDPIACDEPGFMVFEDGDWGPNESAPCMRATLLFDANAPWDQISQNSARIAHITGTDRYLLTFRNGSDAVAARFVGSGPSGPEWQWWDGAAWQAGGTYDFAPIRPSGWGSGQTMFVSADGQVSILIRNGNDLREILYDDATETFSVEASVATIRSASGASGFCTGRAPNGTAWLISTPDGHRIEYRRRPTAQSVWSAPQAIYSDMMAEIYPAAIGFAGNAIPVLVLAESLGGNEHRLCAISSRSSFWNTEVPLQVDPPPAPMLLSPSRLVYEREVVHRAPPEGGPPEGQAYGAGTPGSMGVDADGYVYSGRYANTSLIIHPPNGQTWEDNHQWGLHWDFFDFPGGADVDNLRGKVYVADDMVLGGQGGLSTGGTVEIWEVARRDESVGYQAAGFIGYQVPPFFNKEYFSQTIGNFKWPADVAVDEQAGLLYVVNALRARVDVFDIENLWDDLEPFDRDGLFTAGIPSSYDDVVAQLVIDLVNINYLDDGGPPGDDGGNDLLWVSQDLEGEIIPFLKVQTSFLDLPTNRQQRFLRNVHQEFKKRINRPDFLTSFGSYGTGPGEFRFPQGIDVDESGNVYVVDSENHRIQRWRDDGAGYVFDSAWGQIGRGPGEFAYPFGIAIDNTYGVVHVTDLGNDRVQAFGLSGDFRYEWGAWEDASGVRYLDRSAGIATDDRGQLLIGVDRNIARFRVADSPPKLVVLHPPQCEVMPYGANDVTVQASDDHGVTRFRLRVFANGTLIFDKQYPGASGLHTLEWNLGAVIAGSAGKIEVTAFDTLDQATTRVVLVRLGGVGTRTDSDNDGIPDSCDNCPDHANPDQADCDFDGEGDVCAIAGGAPDCNGNGIPDSCDLAARTAFDCNGNGIPDECETDCNGNGLHDDCDLASGTSLDCNENDIPDECDIAAGTSKDCNANGVPDECEYSAARDCNDNGVLDECDIANGVSVDCDGNLIPDDCELRGRLMETIVSGEPLGGPAAVVADHFSSDLFVLDQKDLKRVTVDGAVGVITNDFAGGLLAAAQDILADELIVTSWSPFGTQLYRVDSVGTVMLLADLPTDSLILGIAIEPQSGRIFVSRPLVNAIDEVLPDGTLQGIVAGAPLSSPGALLYEATSGALVCADGAGQLWRVTLAGTTELMADTSSVGTFFSLAKDYRTGDYLGTSNLGEVLRVTPTGSSEVWLAAPSVGSTRGFTRHSRTGRFAVTTLANPIGVHWFYPENDCNGNQQPDPCDIAQGIALDLDGNGVPDACDPVRSLGDVNCDGILNVLDLVIFELALSGEELYLATYPDCDWYNADLDCDGFVTEDDRLRLSACIQAGMCDCP